MQGSGVCDVDRRLRRIEVKSFRLILSALLCAVLSVAAGRRNRRSRLPQRNLALNATCLLA